MSKRLCVTVGQIIDKFLGEIKSQVKQSTYSWYENYLRSFKFAAYGLPADKLTPQMAYNWIKVCYGDKSPSTQHAAARTVVRAMNWAVDEKIIPQSPLRKFRKPAPNHREVLITPAQYALLLRSAAPELKPVIKFLWHTGCRPQEMRAIESLHVQGRKIVLPRKLSKGQKKQRVIYLDSMAQRIVNHYARQFPSGPLFRSIQGKAWTKNGIIHAFARLRKRTGVTGLCAYALRHSFITRLLEKGNDVATVAAITGTSTRMVLEVYQHVAQNESRLLALLD